MLLLLKLLRTLTPPYVFFRLRNLYLELYSVLDSVSII